jgi:hypothetical protein
MMTMLRTRQVAMRGAAWISGVQQNCDCLGCMKHIAIGSLRDTTIHKFILQELYS